MQDNFERCLEHVLKYEGGYVDHPRDPGGATNKGITIGTLSRYIGRRASKSDVRNISDITVRRIYKGEYWDNVRGDELPYGLDLVAFDGGVNSGPSRGAKWLQKGLGVAADGAVGPVTLSAAEGAGVEAIERACAARMGFLQRLRHWDAFGRGWTRRVASVEATATAMLTKSRKVLVDQEAKAKKAKEQSASGAAVGAGSGGISTGVELPDVLTYGVIAFAVAIAAALLWRAYNQWTREKAFEAERKASNGQDILEE